MELYQLRTFTAVADEGHLTRAAERLNTSQPSVSAHIKALEEEFGLPLFRRTPKGMVLTKEGEILKGHAEQALDAARELTNKAASLKGDLSGVVKIGLNSDPEFLRTGGFFKFINENYPGLEMHMFQSFSGKILDALKDGSLDAGYIYGDNEYPEIKAEKICSVNLVIAGASKWKDKLEGADWEVLSELPWVWYPSHCPYRKVVTDLFSDKKLSPLKAAVADNEATLRTLVESGAGLALLEEIEAVEMEKKGKIGIWRGTEIEIDLSFAYLKNRQNDPIISSLWSGVKNVWDNIDI